MGIYQLHSSKPILCFKVTGTLTRSELGLLQAAAVAGIKDWGKVNALVILEDFQGWTKEPGWDDMSFADEHDQNIKRMAVVGPEKWRDWVCAFVGKGFRSATIEYFLPSQLEKARKWLSDDTPSS